MSVHRWIRSLAMLFLVSAVITGFIISTSCTLVRNLDSTYQFIRMNETDAVALYCIIIASAVLLWLASGFALTALGARPVHIVFEADARSYWFLMALSIDWIRFFPGPWVAIFPNTRIGLGSYRLLAALFGFLGLIYLKRKQYKAIRNGTPTPSPGHRSITVMVALAFPLIWLSGKAVELHAKQNEPVKPETAEATMRFEPFREMLKAMEIPLVLKPGEKIDLPRGRFRVTSAERPDCAIQMISAVLPQAVTGPCSGIEFELPLFSLATEFSLMPDQGRPIELMLQPEGAAVIAPEVWKWMPETHDARFSQLRLPEPWKAYLYRLDANAYSLEPEGFWVKSEKTARFAILTQSLLQPMQIALHSLVRNDVEVRQSGWKKRLMLKPLEEVPISFPLSGFELSGGIRLYPLEFSSSSGTNSGEVSRNVTDRRDLGVFVKLADEKWQQKSLDSGDGGS
jgi:hypothetical protein